MVVGPRGRMRPGGGFLYLYFLFSFFIKIYFRFGNLQEYTLVARLPGGRDLVARLPGGRDLAARQRGGRGIYEKNFAEKIVFRSLSLGAGRPVAGRPAPQAARQRGGRPWPPDCKATGSPTLI